MLDARAGARTSLRTSPKAPQHRAPNDMSEAACDRFRIRQGKPGIGQPSRLEDERAYQLGKRSTRNTLGDDCEQPVTEIAVADAHSRYEIQRLA